MQSYMNHYNICELQENRYLFMAVSSPLPQRCSQASFCSSHHTLLRFHQRAAIARIEVSFVVGQLACWCLSWIVHIRNEEVQRIMLSSTKQELKKGTETAEHSLH